MGGALRTVIRMVGIAALLALLTLILIGNQHPLQKGSAAPVTRMRVLDGRTVDVAFTDVPTFVNIWATWCPPCLQELPELQSAHVRWGDRVRFVGLAVNSRPEDIQRIVERFGVSYPVGQLLGGEGWNAEMLPSSYIVDAGGKVIWSVSGAIDGKVLDDALRAVMPVAPRE